MSRRGAGRPNPSRKTKFSGASGDGENIIFPVTADHEQDWQPCPVDSYSAESTDHVMTVHLHLSVIHLRRGRLRVRTDSVNSRTWIIIIIH